jgi:hypothetical protein
MEHNPRSDPPAPAPIPADDPRRTLTVVPPADDPGFGKGTSVRLTS